MEQVNLTNIVLRVNCRNILFKNKNHMAHNLKGENNSGIQFWRIKKNYTQHGHHLNLKEKSNCVKLWLSDAIKKTISRGITVLNLSHLRQLQRKPQNCPVDGKVLLLDAHQHLNFWGSPMMNLFYIQILWKYAHIQKTWNK